MNEGVITKIKYTKKSNSNGGSSIQIRLDSNIVIDHTIYNVFILSDEENQKAHTKNSIVVDCNVWYQADLVKNIGSLLNKKCEFEVEKDEKAEIPPITIKSIIVKADGV